MNIIRMNTALGLAVFAGGCAIHPLPADFSRHLTTDIVYHVRCELSQAVIKKMYDVLEMSPATVGLANKLRNREMAFRELEKVSVPEPVNGLIDKFKRSVFGLKFTLTATENNNTSGNASLKMPFTNGSFTLALTGGSEKGRSSERTIDISNSVYDLVVQRGDECQEIDTAAKSPKYPLTGNIGLSEVVGTIYTLVNDTDTPITYSDELTFTTKIHAGVNPSVTLSKLVPNELRLVSGGVDHGSDRTDKHNLLINYSDIRKDPSTKDRVPLGSGVVLLIPKVKIVERNRFVPVRPRRRGQTSRRRSGVGSFAVNKDANRLNKQRGLNDLNEAFIRRRERRIDDLAN